MEYSVAEQRMRIQAQSLVCLSLYRHFPTAEEEERLPTEPSAEIRSAFPELFSQNGDRIPLFFQSEETGFVLEIASHVHAIADEDTDIPCLSRVFVTEQLPEFPSKRLLAYVRGMMFLCAYMYAMISERKKVKIQIILYNQSFGARKTLEETVALRRLEAFYLRLRGSFTAYASEEIHRLTVRLPSMEALHFPYPTPREGQRALMQATHHAIAKSKLLLASAPTGTGKTVSVLYPAIRAMGEGKTKKIFYFTPKGTTAQTAKETMECFGKSGAQVRAAILSAKERLCPHGLACREGGACPCLHGRAEAADRALSDLLCAHIPVVTAQEFLSYAALHHVCPYELSLAYSQAADVIICDYNYLFHPTSYLRRYFSTEGDYCFLVDEAHNLPDRLRESYSFSFSLSDLKRFSHEMRCDTELSEALQELRTAFLHQIYALCRKDLRRNEKGEQEGAVSGSALPAEISEWFFSLHALCLNHLRKHGFGLPTEEKKALRAFVQELSSITEILSHYDQRFCFFLSVKDRDMRFRVFCMDPSGIVADRLSHGTSAVLFSATLSPIDYYRSLLAGDRPADIVEVPSPFPEENLCIAVYDGESIRFRDREEGLLRVARILRTAITAKQGNYMVFCPSFAYLQQIAPVFHSLCPDLPLLTQGRSMSLKERQAFMQAFSEDSHVVGFCVLGGIYSEGIDLAGDRLIGSIILGVGHPTPTEEREAISAYFAERAEDGRAYAYLYPGVQRILQSAGRVIRREDDRGIVLIVDDRFSDPMYRRAIPPHWHGLRYTKDLPSLEHLLHKFWN